MIYMTSQSHDHNFKNLLLDFPKEALEFFFPEALEAWGNIQKITFVRQEPKKHHLSDASLELDMPILFQFKEKTLLLWLVEFQEDKGRFSIHKLMRYTADLMELHPDAVVVPTVLFTDRKRWNKDVLCELDSRIANRVFVHFEYIFCKLFDLNARDYFFVNNPVVKILLPKMHYDASDRTEVIVEAYKGLHQLTSIAMFQKYMYFIDLYADVAPEEQERLFQKIISNKETVMLAEYIKNKGRQEGREEGREEGRREGIESVISMIRKARKQGLSVEMIAGFTNLDPILIRKVLNNETVDIPLHLLTQE